MAVEALASQDSTLALFAAQTLKHKLVYDWRQLDDPSVLGLREQLWSLLLPQPRVPRNVAVQLELALAALIVQVEPSVWPDPVGDLFRISAEATGEVLELLTVIPEQLKNPAIRFPSNDAYYERCERLLEAHIDAVIQKLLVHLSSLSVDGEEASRALTCLLSWIQYGGNGSRLIESPEFLKAMFQLLRKALLNTDEDDDSDTDAMVDTCSELLIELSIRMSGRIDDDEGGESRGDAWFSRLSEAWLPLLATELSTLPPRFARFRSTVSLVSEVGHVFLDQLMHSQPAQFAQICQALLAVTEQCPTAVAELTFSFWAAMPDCLSSWSSTGDQESQVQPFLPVYGRLFTALLQRHLPFPVVASPEEVDRFREMRHVIGDTLKDCVRVMGATETLALLKPWLTAPTLPWQEREAALFALRTVASAVDPRESEIMPQISAQLPGLLDSLLLSSAPISGVRKPVSAIVLNVGCYAEWLRYHAEHLPAHLSVLSGALQYALSSPSNPIESPHSIVSASLQSLKYVAESMAGQLGRHYVALEGLFCTCFPSPLLSTRDRLDLMEALCLVLARRTGISDDQFMGALEVLLNPVWAVGAWDAYGVALESLLMPELPRTPLIFERLFKATLPQLLSSMVVTVDFSGGEEAFGEAWLRCLQAALNNGTAGAVEEVLREFILPWLESVGSLSASREATLMALTASIISGGFLSGDVGLLRVACGQLSKGSLAGSEQFCVEKLNLYRVCLIYYPTLLKAGALMRSTGGWAWIQEKLQVGAAWSAAEISALTGFMAALLGGCGAEDALEEDLIGGVEWLVAVFGERVLLEWPLAHCHDLATVLARAARTKPLSLRLKSIFTDRLLPACLPVNGSTEGERLKLGAEWEAAWGECERGGRGRGMRALVREGAEMARRRQM